MAWSSRIQHFDDPYAQTRWRALWEISPQRSVFSSPGYIQAAADTFGYTAAVHLISSADGRDEAGAVAFERRIGPYREAVVPPFTPHSPLIFGIMPRDADVNQRSSSLEALLEGLEKAYGRLRFQLDPSIADVRTFGWRGWDVRPYYTYVSVLAETGDVTDGWSARTKQTFRNERDAFTVEERNNAAISDIVRLYVASLSRQRHALPTRPGQIANLIQRLHVAGTARLFVIRDRATREPAGGMAMLVDGSTAYYWLGGSAPGSAMTVLLGEMLPRLRQDGIRRIDYVGANTPSIAEFKRQFGGSLARYFGVEKLNRPGLRLLDAVRKIRAGIIGR